MRNSGYLAPSKDTLLELSKLSPVDLIHTSLRSISTSSTIETDRVDSDLDPCSLDLYSCDTGLCYSSGSEESVEGLFTGIELFDALVMESLPRLKILPATVELLSQVNFDVPDAPHREGAEDKAFGRTCETIEKTLPFDLKRIISSFRRDIRSKNTSNRKTSQEQHEDSIGLSSETCQNIGNDKKGVLPEAKVAAEGVQRMNLTTKNDNNNINNGTTSSDHKGPTKNQAVGKDMVDFMFMVPRF